MNGGKKVSGLGLIRFSGRFLAFMPHASLPSGANRNIVLLRAVVFPAAGGIFWRGGAGGVSLEGTAAEWGAWQAESGSQQFGLRCRFWSATTELETPQAELDCNR